MLGIVIAVYRRYQYLLDYLKVWDGHKVVVVDIDPIESYTSTVEHKRVVIGKCSYSKAVNTGLALLDTDIMCFSNDDIVPTNYDAAPTLISFLTANPNHIVGISKFNNYIEGSFTAFTKQALIDIGYLDERYPGCYEDVDWSRRSILAGYELTALDLGLKHIDLGSLDNKVHQSLKLYKEKWL